MSLVRLQAYPRGFRLIAPVIEKNQTIQRVLFSFQKTATALDVVHGFQEEFKVLKVIEPSSRKEVSNEELEKMDVPSLLRSCVIQAKANEFVLDQESLEEQLRLEKENLQRKQQEFDELTAIRSVVDAKTERTLKIIRNGALVFLLGQLGSIISLTYIFSWDLMEPITNLIVMGNGVLAFGMSLFRRTEFGYEDTEPWIRDLQWKRHSRKLSFDWNHYERIRKEYEGQLQVHDFLNSFVNELDKKRS